MIKQKQQCDKVKWFKRSPNTWRRFDGQVHPSPVLRQIQDFRGETAVVLEVAGPGLESCLQDKSPSVVIPGPLD